MNTTVKKHLLAFVMTIIGLTVLIGGAYTFAKYPLLFPVLVAVGLIYGICYSYISEKIDAKERKKRYQ